jgi:peptide deformylase
MSKSLHILTIDNPKEEKVLRSKSQDIKLEKLEEKDFREFLEDLKETAESSEEQVGVQSAGISAPQVGKNIRVFYILDSKGEKFKLFVNPKIDIINLKQDIEYEGCLSVPNVEEPVARYKKIRVTYIDENGKKQRGIFKDMEAREIQHEADHLEGILFIDKIEK